MAKTVLRPNPGKNLTITVDGKRYARYPIKTHVISPKDEITQVVATYAGPYLKDGDTVVVSERVVAITQGRMYLIKDIRPSIWANLFVKFVYKPSWGIGIGSPYTMQVAISEAGLPRMLLAAGISALTKPFGIRGMFYRVVGHQINAIDGPTPYTLPPGNMAATLGPKDPNKVTREIKNKLGCAVAIIDANDIGQRIEGATSDVDRDLICRIFKDNPLGQSKECTPMAIVRKI
ncbi:F420-0--gamma-glutamyl ligase [Candidatus Gottesmanbacteria bacterium RIFCSPHIGHO2_01_FULL_42_12]|uniref:F420-0--gamma-glutamyl ligase n=1 Tax=Candidatus Gottesmanbacteria bacterium RIFCSPHIGHO2_01_FULL_42_12 TaxID=1798377 RepID=A0A1F5YZL7_9BACT|nr:MAG: F420-0--gamma-glutamyl ligase [Candidatus Gottesmanbacteria bacterium RIFCSPHIGHO2_01_FULL_42_12]